MLEVRWTAETASSHWFARVVVVSGQFLGLSYIDDVNVDISALNGSVRFDFWVDAMSLDVHELGWCETNEATLSPPPGANFL